MSRPSFVLPWLRHAAGLWLLALLLTLAGGAARAADAAALRLGPWTPAVEAWPATRVLFDPEERLDAAAAHAALERFQRPAGPHGNLGARTGASWLHVPLQLEPDAPTQWVLRFIHPILHRLTVHVFDDRGQVLLVSEIGTRIPFAQRELATRTLATELRLQPGRRYDLLVRVATPTASVVALALLQPAALAAEEAEEHALQGLMNGLWLFMAIYCLINGLQQRRTLWLAYGGALVSTWLFTHALYGTGPKYLWPQQAWLAMNMSALAPLLGVAANTRFFVGALDLRRRSPRRARIFDATGLAALLLAIAFASGAVGYRVASIGGMSLGLLHLLLALRPAYVDARGGDRAAAFLLAGWSINVVGVVQICALLLGALPVNHFNLHVAQYAFAIEMTNWLIVLGLRLQQLRQAAAEERRLREQFDAQAHTDALTGLLNRRGLERALAGPQAGSSGRGAERPGLALFMIDLDGFKPVNDRWGHEAGDELLRQVAARLRAATRTEDVVARLGGDEFVVAASTLPGCEAAAAVGRKLLACFEAPFELGAGRVAAVGATIGCARSATRFDLTNLLRQADAAMYAGKQAGKGVLSTCADAGA